MIRYRVVYEVDVPPSIPEDERRVLAAGVTGARGVEPVSIMEMPFPVVALVGSTLFKQEYDAQARRLVVQGCIPLGVEVRKSKDWCDEDVTPEMVDMLDAMKRTHIEMADRVLVINVGGYVGESTMAHIAYALERGKPVDYLEPG